MNATTFQTYEDRCILPELSANHLGHRDCEESSTVEGEWVSGLKRGTVHKHVRRSNGHWFGT